MNGGLVIGTDMICCEFPVKQTTRLYNEKRCSRETVQLLLSAVSTTQVVHQTTARLHP
jgi:hypothetical protein